MPGTSKTKRKHAGRATQRQTKTGRRRVQEKQASTAQQALVPASEEARETVTVDIYDLERRINIQEELDKIVDGASLECVRDVISAAAGFPEHQLDAIHRSMQWMMGEGREPKPTQVEAVRRLVFGLGDTLLIAATGFGKSVVYQSFPALTSKTMIQLVPISALGLQQAFEIEARIPGAKVCLLTADTKRETPNLLQKLRCGGYTHILLGPEQATSNSFRALFRDPQFAGSIGLVAFDEAHLVKNWGMEFREDFTLVRELRRLVPKQCIWFGCTATLDKETEPFVIESAGFRALTADDASPEAKAQGLKIIRTDLDRPDITLRVEQLPAGKLSDFRSMWFAVKDASKDGVPTPAAIPKTIIFMDSRTSIRRATFQLREFLKKHHGYNKALFNQTVEMYTSRTAKWDKDRIVSEFQKEDSHFRIIVATTALGLGVDLPDVDVVIQWGIPPSLDLCDLWQRWGRCCRAQGRRGIAFLFAPWYYFANSGFDPRPENTRAAWLRSRLKTKKKKKRNPKNTPRYSQTQSQSQSSQVQATADASDGEDSDSSVQSPGPSQQRLVASSSSGLKTYSDAQLEARDTLPDSWHAVLNGPCRRKPMMEFLQQLETFPSPSGSPQCCDKCAKLSPMSFDNAPALEIVEKRPANGRPAMALQRLEKWLKEKAAVIRPLASSRARMPASFIMPARMQWQLVRKVFKYLKYDPFERVRDVEHLKTAFDVEQWRQWRFAPQLGEELVTFLNLTRTSVQEDWENEKQNSQVADADTSQPSPQAQRSELVQVIVNGRLQRDVEYNAAAYLCEQRRELELRTLGQYGAEAMRPSMRRLLPQSALGGNKDLVFVASSRTSSASQRRGSQASQTKRASIVIPDVPSVGAHSALSQQTIPSSSTLVGSSFESQADMSRAQSSFTDYNALSQLEEHRDAAVPSSLLPAAVVGTRGGARSDSAQRLQSLRPGTRRKRALTPSREVGSEGPHTPSAVPEPRTPLSAADGNSRQKRRQLDVWGSGDRSDGRLRRTVVKSSRFLESDYGDRQ